MKGFASIAAPMTKLTKKGARFIWTPNYEQSFQGLKKRLVSAPILSLPQSNNDFNLQYHPRKANIVANALSQKLMALSFHQKNWKT